MVFGGFVAPVTVGGTRFGDVEGGLEEPGVMPGEVDAYGYFHDDGYDDGGAQGASMATVSASALVGNQRGLQAVENMARSRIMKLATERRHDRVNKARKAAK